ncbi:hypothetical protein [Planctomicrobium piriforme]|nr:hypothetical protein [Planctomicrobium piriforme]
MSAVFMLIIVGAMISHARKPSTWNWLVEDVNREILADDSDGDRPAARQHLVQQPIGPAPADAPAGAVPVPEEVLIPNPIDTDPEEWAAAEDQFRDIRDKSPISVEEMPSYWRLFRWSRAQKRADLDQRAQRDLFFTQLWEQPKKYRGKPVSLKLHVRRVLSFDAPENSAGVKKVYELWGVTDESRAHPYVVLTDELPPGFPEGAAVDADARFTGYFLKIMGYEASDAQRGAPLLIGKLKGLPSAGLPARDPKAARQEFWQSVIIGLVVIGILAALPYIPWPWRKKAASVRQVVIKHSEDEAEEWLSKPPTGRGDGSSGSDADRSFQ